MSAIPPGGMVLSASMTNPFKEMIAVLSMVSGQCRKESGTESIKVSHSRSNPSLFPCLTDIIRLYEHWAVP